jgi:hypothetical protein
MKEMEGGTGRTIVMWDGNHRITAIAVNGTERLDVTE